MENFNKLRESFNFQKQMILDRKENEKADVCSHAWNNHREDIRADRTDDQIRQGMIYLHGAAYFIVRECEKCGEKRNIDFKVED